MVLVWQKFGRFSDWQSHHAAMLGSRLSFAVWLVDLQSCWDLLISSTSLLQALSKRSDLSRARNASTPWPLWGRFLPRTKSSEHRVPLARWGTKTLPREKTCHPRDIFAKTLGLNGSLKMRQNLSHDFRDLKKPTLPYENHTPSAGRVSLSAFGREGCHGVSATTLRKGPGGSESSTAAGCTGQ